MTVNDRPVTRAESEPMHFSWPELVAQAARETRLRPGDVLGSGTLTAAACSSSGRSTGAGSSRATSVALWAEGLGELRTEVA